MEVLKINLCKDQNAIQTSPIQAEKYAVQLVILRTERGRRGGREVAAAVEGKNCDSIYRGLRGHIFIKKFNSCLEEDWPDTNRYSRKQGERQTRNGRHRQRQASRPFD